MNDDTLIAWVETGVTKLPNNKLMKAYQFITGKPMRSNCGECAKRSAIKTILNYYNKLKTIA